MHAHMLRVALFSTGTKTHCKQDTLLRVGTQLERAGRLEAPKAQGLHMGRNKVDACTRNATQSTAYQQRFTARLHNVA